MGYGTPNNIMNGLHHSKKFYLSILAVLAILLSLNVVFYYFSPQDIVETLGVDNSYITVFAIAAIGGLSSFTSAALYSAIATFAAGGAVPWLLGLIGGIGIAIGDMIVFSLLRYGYTSVDTGEHGNIKKIRHYLERTPVWSHYLVLYVILGFTPLPNDIILAILVVLGFRIRSLAPILILSGVTIALITAYTGQTILEYML